MRFRSLFKPFGKFRPSGIGTAKRPGRGFTMPEMLVSIAIIGLISSITLVNIQAMRHSGRLNNTALEIVTDLRRMQNRALGVGEFNGQEPDGGWGVRLSKQTGDNNEYRLFADWAAANPGKYIQGDDGTADSELIQAVSLPEGIIINDFTGVGNGRYLYVVFEPPDSEAHINAALNESNNTLSGEDFDSVEIELMNEITGDTIVITVNRFGLLDIKND